MPITVLRTAAGSAPAVTHYKQLQELGLRVVATDADPLSVGFAFADAAYQVPRAASPAYLGALLTICERERVDWVIPALDEELVLLASNLTSFAARGTRVLTSGIRCLEVCVDKFRTYEFFQQNGVPTPRTALASGVVPGEVRHYPQIVKPRHGRGSTNVYTARDASELGLFIRYLPDSIVQERIDGRELTIDVLADLNSDVLFVRPRHRIQTESGISYKGATMWDESLVSWVDLITRRLGIVGPANIQCFLDDIGGKWFTEVNARLAGSVALTIAADPEFAEALVDLLAERKPKRNLGPPRPLVMLRYWSEIYLDPERAAGLGKRP